MLKGQRLLTDSFFGRVINDAEHEQVVILEATRARRIWEDPAGYFPRRAWWEVISETVVIPWTSIRRAEICKVQPPALHARKLRR